MVTRCGKGFGDGAKGGSGWAIVSMPPMPENPLPVRSPTQKTEHVLWLITKDLDKVLKIYNNTS